MVQGGGSVAAFIALAVSFAGNLVQLAPKVLRAVEGVESDPEGCTASECVVEVRQLANVQFGLSVVLTLNVVVAFGVACACIGCRRREPAAVERPTGGGAARGSAGPSLAALFEAPVRVRDYTESELDVYRPRPRR